MEATFGKLICNFHEISFKIGIAPLGIIRQKRIGGYAPSCENNIANGLYRQECFRVFWNKSSTACFEEVGTYLVFHSGNIIDRRFQFFSSE